MKKFLISIDTEGDDLWSWKPGMPIHTENSVYLPRFQHLCEAYGYKPTYLTNAEMIADERYTQWAVPLAEQGACEIGMHLHAWNTPPLTTLPTTAEHPGAPYLIEYPEEIMEQKIAAMTSLLQERTGRQAITHRAGRWAMDERYFRLLKRYGYEVDCSVTPHMDWRQTSGQSQGSRGSDYTEAPEVPTVHPSGVLEVPVTIRQTHRFILPERLSVRGLAASAKLSAKGQKVWLRPNGKNTHQMCWLIDRVAEETETDYIMFMLHSSELMPGGSPFFRSAEAIEHLYRQISTVFAYSSKRFEGMTIGDYARQRQGEGST